MTKRLLHKIIKARGERDLRSFGGRERDLWSFGASADENWMLPFVLLIALTLRAQRRSCDFPTEPKRGSSGNERGGRVSRSEGKERINQLGFISLWVVNFFGCWGVTAMRENRRPGAMGSWYRVARSLQAVAAHGLLLSLTALLVMKLNHTVSCSWWIIFIPLWLFHVTAARGRFSLPAPSPPRDRHWAPCHAVVATPLIVSFELLLCIFLESLWVHSFPAVNLKIVFLPLLTFELLILIDNFRMCRALMPSDEEGTNDEAIWEILPHFWVAISMVFLVAATILLVLKLTGDVGALGWWDIFINFGIAECFSFLVCTKWSNPAIHRQPHQREPSSSSEATRYLDWNSGLVITANEDESENHVCAPQDIGGHIIKIPVITFQVLLCMRLQSTPQSARHIPLGVLFLPLFLLQGAGVLLAMSRLVEKIVLLLNSGISTGQYFSLCSKLRDCFGFLHHGSRLLGWWSIDESSREEQARLFHSTSAGCVYCLMYIVSRPQLDRATLYSTFAGHLPEVVMKMPKKDLAEEVWRLQAALGEQAEITNFSQQEYERLQHEKVLCRVCFEAEIGVVLLPCRHRILCSTCSEKCKKCPICRVPIEERMPVYDV